MTHKNFKITMPIAKAYQETVDGITKRYIHGIASGTNIDLDRERMANSAIEAMQRAIKQGIYLRDGTWSLVPLRVGHRDEFTDIIGWLVDAFIDEHYNLHVIAELDESNPHADMLYRKLTVPSENGRIVKLGMSVGGTVLDAAFEWNDFLGEFIVVFNNIALKEVSIVSQPANPITYVEALQKSLDKSQIAMEQREGKNMESDGVFEEAQNPEIVEKAGPDAMPMIEDEQEPPLSSFSQVVLNFIQDMITTCEQQVSACSELIAYPFTEPGEYQEVIDTAKTLMESRSEELQQWRSYMARLFPNIEDTRVKSMEDVIDVKKDIDAISEALRSLQDTVSGLTDLVKSLAERHVEAPRQDEASDAVEKARVAEQEAEEKPVLTIDALAEIMRQEIAKATSPLLERIQELEEQPIDKSIAVRVPDTDLVNENPIEKFQRMSSGLSGTEVLRKAIEVAYLGN